MQGSYGAVPHHQGPPRATSYGSEVSGHMQGGPQGPPSPYAPRAPYAAPPQQQAPPQYPGRTQYQAAPAPGGPPPQQMQRSTQQFQAPPAAAQPPPQQYHAASQQAHYSEPSAVSGTKRRLENGAAPEAKRPAPTNSARETVFRLLASSRKIGSIIGRGGEIIKQLKAETGARMKVADAVPNCDERVVIISSPPDPSVQWNSAQRAVFEVHRRLLEGDYAASAAGAAPVITRFLVNQQQANQLLQRLDVTNQVRSESGVDIKVMGPQEIPPCALSNDRVLQLTGTAQTLPRALEILSQHFRENPPKEKPGGAPPAVAAILARGHLPAAVNYAAPPPSYASQPPPYAGAPPSYSLPAMAHQSYAAAPPLYNTAPIY